MNGSDIWVVGLRRLMNVLVHLDLWTKHKTRNGVAALYSSSNQPIKNQEALWQMAMHVSAARTHFIIVKLTCYYFCLCS